MQKKLLPYIGVIGAVTCLVLYLRTPSFPTPDKLLIFAFCVGLIFRQGLELLRRLAPFVILLAVYDLFRGFADYLNGNVNFGFMPDVDKLLFFGILPTKSLQNWLWQGSAQWYDFGFYVIYMLHFVLPIVLAVIIWKKREAHYWRFVTAFVVLSFAGFLTYVAFPAAPPWMATQTGVIEPIQRISSDVWWAMGVQDFPSVYNKISPNPVAAVPSLHAAYATLFFIFVIQLFRSRWRYLTLIYPLGIFFGTVYMGEHYVIDAILGIMYAFVAYYVSQPALAFFKKIVNKIPEFGLQRRLVYVYNYIIK